MLSKRISAAVTLVIIAVFGLASIIKGIVLGIGFPSGADPAQRAEAFLREAFPLGRTLSGMRVGLSYALGGREQDSVFIGGDRLIENIQPPVSRYVQSNTNAIIDFASRQSVPVYVMLIPTASAILQNETPRLADSDIYNQKQFIEERYKSLSGKLLCVDVYTTLLEHSSQYIYYNTETLLTMQGGYFVYDELSRRMGNTPYALSRFSIRYLTDTYYGSLYDRVEFRNIEPDVLSLYVYAGSSREFSVTHHGSRTREYNTLYPTHLYELGRPLDVYFGGISPVVDVRQKGSGSARGSLLVFGDEQMRSVLPFLAHEYQRVTLADLSQMTPQQLSNIEFSDYGAILFAYSVDTFMHSDAPSRMGLY